MMTNLVKLTNLIAKKLNKKFTKQKIQKNRTKKVLDLHRKVEMKVHSYQEPCRHELLTFKSLQKPESTG